MAAAKARGNLAIPTPHGQVLTPMSNNLPTFQSFQDRRYSRELDGCAHLLVVSTHMHGPSQMAREQFDARRV